jgi:hypothetical protein
LELIQREKPVVRFHHAMHLVHKLVQLKSLVRVALRKVVDQANVQ